MGRIREWYLKYRLKKGKVLYGRGGLEPTAVKTKMKATISAVITRADGTIEDRGVISNTTVELTPEQIEMLKKVSQRPK